MPVSMPKSMPPKQAWDGMGELGGGFLGGMGKGLTLAQRTKTRQL